MSALVTDNLALIATAPDGIKRLRGLILELAVRGKLVPQDPADEPASELLKRIEAEKAWLVKEGKIRKPKAVEAVGEDERPFEVPETWAWTTLGNAVEVLDSLRKPVTKDERKPGPYPYYGASGIVDYVADYLFDEPLVLVGEDGAKWGAGDQTAFSIIGKTWVNNHAHVLRPIRSAVADAYLVQVLVARDLQQFITGTTVPKLNQAKLVSIEIPLPPIPEQHRIVARVDELMALCDRLEAEQADATEAHARLVDALLATLTASRDAAECAANWQRLHEHFDTLFTTEASITALKQTVLQLAVMGRLVPQHPTDEPASELLHRIEAEKARLVKEGKIRKPTAVEPVGEHERSFELPASWEWTNVTQLSSVVTDGEHSTPPRVNDPTAVPLVTAKNVRNGFMDYGDTDYVPHDVARKCWGRCKPQTGDILVVSVGATTGRLSIVQEAIDMVLVRSVTLIRPIGADVKYVAEAMRSPFLQSAIWKGVKQSAQPCLYLAKSAALPIPLPPLPEQHRIVAKIDELMALCDRLQADLATAREHRARLADTLVQAALEAA